jgi:hypothetical protein
VKPGDYVELHPGTDAWMRGDRYGVVVKVTHGKRVLAVMVRPSFVHVRMDRSGRTLRLRSDRVEVLP